MSNNLSIELLQEEVIRLIDLQKDILGRIQSNPNLMTPDRVDDQDLKKKDREAQQQFTKRAIDEKINNLNENRKKTENLEMVLAVVGTMKAGKSTSINAIVGREVLPNRNRPMTALPTLIRHNKGQPHPVLFFSKREPIQKLSQSLLDKARQLPTLEKHLASDEHLRNALHTLRQAAPIKEKYEGEKNIFDFLAWLNDLVRLSKALNVKFPFSEYKNIEDFPVIEVEFFHLNELDNAGKGKFAVLDTPGFNEEGQKEHLLPMMTEQLRKATAVLAVLDYTQLKSEAEGELRQQLNEIAKSASGRMFSLVNKFDQKDHNSDDEKATQDYVAKNLLKDARIMSESVFPVSSRDAYLAKRAELALSVEGGLRWLPGQAVSWIDDFGEKAFGTRWQRKINDNQEVQEASQDLWEQSLFDAPLRAVIHFGYQTAAFWAIQAATKTLKIYDDELRGMIDTRLQMDDLNLEDISRLIKESSATIQKLDKIQRKSEQNLRSKLDEIHAEAELSIKQISVRTESIIKEFLSTGQIQAADAVSDDLEHVLRRNFREHKNSSVSHFNKVIKELLPLLPSNVAAARRIIEDLEKQDKMWGTGEIKFFFTSHAASNIEDSSLFPGRMSDFSPSEATRYQTLPQIILAKKLTKTTSATKEQEKIFDAEMTYSDKDEAQRELAKISAKISEILQNSANALMRSIERAWQSLDENMQESKQQVAKDMSDFGESARLIGLDALVPEKPKFNKIVVKRKGAHNFDLLIDESTKTRTRLRQQDSAWGWFKRKVDFFDADWGYDEQSYKETKYTIKIDDLKSRWKIAVDEEIERLRKSVETNFTLPAQERSDEFFEKINSDFDLIKENLDHGKRDHETEHQRRAEIKKSLEELKELQANAREDIDAANRSSLSTLNQSLKKAGLPEIVEDELESAE